MKLFENWPLKLISLTIAIIIWLVLASSETKIDTFPGEVSISPVNVPAGLFSTYDQKTVRIKVQAKRAVWEQLSADSFTAELDFNGLDQGTHEVPVKVSSVVQDVDVIEKTPEKITVRLDPIVEKKVPITVKLEGEVGSGYETREPKPKEEQVAVRGPAGSVETLSQAVAVVKLNGETEDIVRSVPLTAIKADGSDDKNLTFIPSEVEVMVPVTKAGEVKVVGIKPQISGKTAAGFFVSSVSVEPVTASISGSSEVLKKIKTIDTQAVSVEGQSRSFSKEASLSLPQGVSLQSEAKVTVSVEIAESEVSKEVSLKLEARSQTGLKVDAVSPSVVRATVSGRRSAVDKLDSLSAVLDLAFKNPGTYTVEIKEGSISTPAGISVLSISPQATAVTLNLRY